MPVNERRVWLHRIACTHRTWRPRHRPPFTLPQCCRDAALNDPSPPTHPLPPLPLLSPPQSYTRRPAAPRTLHQPWPPVPLQQSHHGVLPANVACTGKTSPRLLHDLLTYDPRHQERAGRNLLTSAPLPHDPHQPPVAAVPRRNCRHTLRTKSEQSRLPPAGQQIDEISVYKVASYCNTCRWHVDVVVDFRADAAHRNEACQRASHDWPLHHFLYQGEDDGGSSPAGSRLSPRTYRFHCSAPRCSVQLKITLKPPRFSDHDIETLTNQAQLRQRWERAKQLAGERADAVMARRVDALDYLNTYLHDCLNPAKGKARIPLLNRKFLKTFGQDCDSILMGLGFTKNLEKDEDGSMDEIWYLPRPDEASDPLEANLRNTIEDARYELDTLMQAFPENERRNCRHQPIYSLDAHPDLERLLTCNDCEF